MAKGPTKLSKLPQIENISSEDLLLVSDYDNNACISKKMRMDQLVEHICAGILKEPSVYEVIQQAVTQAVEDAIRDKLEPLIMATVTKENNLSVIEDLLDGNKDGMVTWDGNE